MDRRLAELRAEIEERLRYERRVWRTCDDQWSGGAVEALEAVLTLLPKENPDAR